VVESSAGDIEAWMRTPRHRVQSVDRAMDLLKAVADSESPVSVTELAHRCGLNRATAWRLLGTLEAQDMVVRDLRDGSFALGPAIATMSSKLRTSLVEAAQPMLERVSLETGEVACLGIVHHGRVHYAAEVLPPTLREQSWVDQPVELHASSMGKAVLAYLDDDRVQELIGDHPVRFTPTTITDPVVMREELTRVRARGYAVCRGELEEGLWGVAAPLVGVDGEAVAVVCLWGPDERGDDARLEALGRLASRATRGLRVA